MLIKSQSEVRLHTGRSVHFHPSQFDFSRVCSMKSKVKWAMPQNSPENYSALTFRLSRNGTQLNIASFQAVPGSSFWSLTVKNGGGPLYDNRITPNGAIEYCNMIGQCLNSKSHRIQTQKVWSSKNVGYMIYNNSTSIITTKILFTQYLFTLQTQQA